MKNATTKTIGEAISAAQQSFRTSNRQMTLCVISAETHSGEHQGEYALTEWSMVAREDVYMYVHPNGEIVEGPKAMELPIGAE